jgi:serine/threonine protein kinase
LGEIRLYIQTDTAGNIAQRMVVRTTSIPHEMWIQARRWYVDALNPGAEAQHMEIKVMKEIAKIAGNHKCVRLQHYTTDRSTFSYRMYLSYHPRGDLSYFANGLESIYRKDNRIPEPALWKWFEDLTEACFLLSKGAGPLSDPFDGWKKIVHCDLKPNNVFLDNPDQELWSSYPQAIVGDNVVHKRVGHTSEWVKTRA